jgi:hypothetical protein
VALPDRRVRRGLLIPFLVACLVAATAGSAATGDRRVTVIGDSVASTMQYDSHARAILTRGVDVDLQLAVCRRLVGESCPYAGVRPPTLVGLLPTLQLGSTVVVAVGYNDLESTFDQTVETVLAALEAVNVEHVLWVTLRAERQSYIHMNAIVQAAVARHPELEVVDWNLYSRSHTDWFQDDGLHLNGAGAEAMATLLHRKFAELGLVAPPPPRLAITTRTLPAGTVGHAYRVRLRASGGERPIRWSRLGAIPAGLRLGPGGVIAGTPTAAGTSKVVVRATDAKGAREARRLTITVRPA